MPLLCPAAAALENGFDSRADLGGLEHGAEGPAGGGDQDDDAAAHERDLDDLGEFQIRQFAFALEDPHGDGGGQEHGEIDVAEDGHHIRRPLKD